jgi:hypothetical protein
MSPWLLLAFLLFVWIIWIVGCVAEADVEDAQRGVPEGQRRGVSVLRVFPLFPLTFWGMALLIDRFVGTWGTLIVGGTHLVLGGIWSVSVYRNRRRLAEIGGAD